MEFFNNSIGCLLTGIISILLSIEVPQNLFFESELGKIILSNQVILILSYCRRVIQLEP